MNIIRIEDKDGVQEANITANTPATDPPAPSRKLWKAGEIARRTGLTRQSLHQYVLLGLLTPVELTQGGQRLFDDDAVQRVQLIHNLCDNGYTLRDIRDIFFKNQPHP